MDYLKWTLPNKKIVFLESTFEFYPSFKFSKFWICLNSQDGSGLVGDDDAFGSGVAVSARIESSYLINLRDLDMKHVKDFIFVHGKCY